MKSIILLCLLPICLSHRLCDHSHYWSNDKESCLPCLKCPSHQVTVKPCQAHQNTICKSVSKFDLPWKKDHHKATIHFETDNVNDYDDDIYKDIFSKHLDASGKPLKHERNFDIKQRPNDKFLSWDQDKKNQKHKKHYEFSGSKHHQKFDIFDDESEENKDSKYRGNNHKKNVHRVKLEDEDILKQWLIQSKKQFKIKKDKMLKNLKEEKDDRDDYDDDWQGDDDSDDNDDDDWNDDGDDDWDEDVDWNDDSDDWDDDWHGDGNDDDWDPKKKIKLNYPLHKNDKKMENSHRSSPKRKEAKQLSDIDEELFKDLIKNEDTGDLDVSTLLSNKRDPFAYKATISLGKPSTIKEIIGQVKDPEELIKEEVGRNVIYEKSKISVLPLQKEINDADVISVPFTAAERFVWDWQALALCSALFACLVFFIVVISYTIINARQWKRVKRNYSTELEEMSTKIALMQPTLEAVISENPTKIESQKH